MWYQRLFGASAPFVVLTAVVAFAWLTLAVAQSPAPTEKPGSLEQRAIACEQKYIVHGKPVEFIDCMRPWLGFAKLGMQERAKGKAMCVKANQTFERECCFAEDPRVTVNGNPKIAVACAPHSPCPPTTCDAEDCESNECTVVRPDVIATQRNLGSLFLMGKASEDCSCETKPLSTARAIAAASVATLQSCCNKFGVTIWQCHTCELAGLC